MIPMTGSVPQRLEHQTVLVLNGTIARVGSAADVPLPVGATVVEGRGRFLIPGLTDSHVHLWDDGAELPLYLAAGVTTIHVLMGWPEQLAWRSRVQAGQMVGPRLLLSGPLLGGPEVSWKQKVTPSTAAEGAAAAGEQIRAGYDFIKIYDGLPSEAYGGAVGAARAAGIPVRGHIPESVGLAGVLRAGQTIEHVEKIVYATWPAPHVFDTLRIPLIADSIRRAGVWVTPTLAVHEMFARIASGRFDSLMARPEVTLAPGGLLNFWRTVSAQMRGTRIPPSGTQFNSFVDYQIALARGLHRAGVPFLAGTDLPNGVMVPGFALSDELETLVRDVGLTPFEALQTATINPAILARDSTHSGTIVAGKRADLLLLDADPLADIGAVRRVSGVVAAGWYYAPATLTAMVRPKRSN